MIHLTFSSIPPWKSSLPSLPMHQKKCDRLQLWCAKFCSVDRNPEMELFQIVSYNPKWWLRNSKFSKQLTQLLEGCKWSGCRHLKYFDPLRVNIDYYKTHLPIYKATVIHMQLSPWSMVNSPVAVALKEVIGKFAGSFNTHSTPLWSPHSFQATTLVL